MTAPKLCRACTAGTCPECANWGAPTPWCEHLCQDSPRQLPLPMGDDDGFCRPTVPPQAGRTPPDDEEVPW